MKKYVVQMFNKEGCDIAHEIVEARDEYEAIEVFKEELSVIEYDGDRYFVEEY